MKTHAKISSDGTIELTDNQRIYLKDKHAGKSCFVEIDEDINRELRSFFEGAVVPYFFLQNPKANWENYRDCREALKLEFNPLYITDIEGHKQTVPKSTVGTKQAFKSFLERVERGFMENGFDFPNSEEYKQWRDTNTDIDAVYPPVARLKEKYLSSKKSQVPPWRQ